MVKAGVDRLEPRKQDRRSPRRFDVGPRGIEAAPVGGEIVYDKHTLVSQAKHCLRRFGPIIVARSLTQMDGIQVIAERLLIWLEILAFLRLRVSHDKVR